MPKTALITGITGQDGRYLAELLLSHGYTVYGVKRRASLLNTQRIDHLYRDPHEEDNRLHLYYGDMTDATNLIRIVQETQPDEIYNLAAQSHVKVSFETAEYTANADALGTLRLLEAVRLLGLVDKTKFYQASTSELYGKVREVPQSETTPFYPRSPYAAAKLYAYWIAVNYREAYGMFASNGILFNHESPVRGETFVTRKITRAVTRIALGMQSVLFLGNIDACRDWGHAKDYARAMWLILQHKEPDDFVVSTGEQHSVREFVELAFQHVGISLAWKGTGVSEAAVVSSLDTERFSQMCPRDGSTIGVEVGTTVVVIDPRYFRPTEVETLLGNSEKARDALGWRPEIGFCQLVEEMVSEDMRAACIEIVCMENGHTIVPSYEDRRE